MKKIAIIGAGPAGIMAALQAAQSAAAVHLFESNAKIGKKLLVTGSGRCNITNLQAGPDRYDTDDKSILTSILKPFSPEGFREKLAGMGIVTTATEDGWIYPLSYAAGNVVELLQAQLNAAGVQIHYAARVNAIQRGDDGFVLGHDKHDAPHEFDLVCVASGGKAMPDLGSDGKLFPILASLGHQLMPIKPALAPITFEDKTLHTLDGVRLDVEVSLWQGAACLRREKGNVIFTQWGMNGPAVMNLSHLLPENPDPAYRLQINFLPGYEAAAQKYLWTNKQSSENLAVLMGGFLNQKISAAFCKKAGIGITQPRMKINPSLLEKYFSLITAYRVQPGGTRGFKYAQLSCGGIPLTEMQAGTLESRLQPGLYLAGEVLNVVGPCGGYNLHWAFASGYAVGKALAVRAAQE